MYVGDVDDLDELADLLLEAEDRLSASPNSEQAQWDVEDIQQRIEEVSAQVNGGEDGDVERS
ncbi:hypothetical protein SEA_YECEY3_80 [Mycobacterium phage Yecey3]|uniref:Uncharacterized protein n=1 Tax=Mycobacterium phage Yecey3 TaxID=2656617 RepID=A0A649V8Z9_9CAUD|nr:hypothetical protein KIV58_gp029 [Mycobacterium phage Yecey3]QGJ88831.1 hypothetical protein SEA_YECEY3_80 [Mycobacterium phage Yecey3]